MDELQIISAQAAGYVAAHEGDCVYLRWIGHVHTTVMHDVCMTIATSHMDIGVVVRK